MNKQEFLVWKAGLIQLTSEQKKALNDSMKTLGMQSDKSEVENEDWLIKGLLVALRKHGASHYYVSTIEKSISFKRYKSSAPKLLKKLSKIAGPSTSSQSTLAYLCGVALIRWCERHCAYPVKDKTTGETAWVSKPMTAKLIMENAKNIFLALEEQFPGYLAANMLPMIIISTSGHTNVGKDKRSTARKHPNASRVQQPRRRNSRKPAKS